MKKLIFLLVTVFMLVGCAYTREVRMEKDEAYTGIVSCCPILSATEPSTGEAKTLKELIRYAEFYVGGGL